MKNMDKFRQKAEALARIEQEIYEYMKRAGQEATNAYASGKKPSAAEAVIPAAVAAVAAVVTKLTWSKGLIAVGAFLVCLFMLGKTYTNWQNYKMRKAAYEESCAQSGKAVELDRKRNAMIGELNALRDPSDGRRYWWDAGISPAVLPDMPGEWLQDASEWTLGLYNEIQLEVREGGIYLHDFTEEPVFYTADRVEALRTGRTAELYRDKSAYGTDATAYVCKHLYACQMEPLEEIESSTTVYRVDKKQAMDAYRGRLDDYEKQSNSMLNGNYLTNKDLYNCGKISASHDLELDVYRTLAEQDYESEIPDTVSHTSYAKTFNNFFSMDFLTCAYIFIAADGRHAGQTALILMPQEQEESIGFTVRLKSLKEFSGYLDSYVGFEPLSIGGVRIRPSLALFAEALFRGSYRDILRLKPRDVLAPKPANLTDEEWSYLIRSDTGI